MSKPLITVIALFSLTACQKKPTPAPKSQPAALASCADYYQAMARCGMGIRKGSIGRCETRWKGLDQTARDAQLAKWRSTHYEQCLKPVDISSVPRQHYCHNVRQTMMRCGAASNDRQLLSCYKRWQKGGFDRQILVRGTYDFAKQVCPKHAEALSPAVVFALKGPLVATTRSASIIQGNTTLRFRFMAPPFERQKPRMYKGKPVRDEVSFTVPGGGLFDSLHFYLAGYRSLPLPERLKKYLGEGGSVAHMDSKLPGGGIGRVVERRNEKNGRISFQGEWLFPTTPGGPTLRCAFRANKAAWTRYRTLLIGACRSVTITP